MVIRCSTISTFPMRIIANAIHNNTHYTSWAIYLRFYFTNNRANAIGYLIYYYYCYFISLIVRTYCMASKNYCSHSAHWIIASINTCIVMRCDDLNYCLICDKHWIINSPYANMLGFDEFSSKFYSFSWSIFFLFPFTTSD